jgi:hypothetical protein
MILPEKHRVGSLRQLRRCKIWGQRLAALLAAAFLFAPGNAQARKKKPKPLTPEEVFAQRIASIVQPLYGMALDESHERTSEVEKLVVGHMQEWLEQHPPKGEPADIPYDVDVRRELESNFSRLRFPVYAWPSTFAVPWKDRLMIGAGYTLGWTKYERANVLALFEREQGKVKLAAVTNFIPRVDLHYNFFPPRPSGDFRFLAYGTRLGKSHPRLSVELYSFDGQKLTSLWKTEDVYDGKLEVEGDRVMLNYMKEAEFIEAATYNRIPPRYEAVYKLTPEGIQLITDRQLPPRGQ